MAHITGGGITENLPRILPEGAAARIDRATWRVPRIFEWLQRTGKVPEEDMMRTFNMGIGLIVACDDASADGLVADLGPGATRIGRVEAGHRGVTYSGR
jgi:phosphoribosylformylglycinamidine cyclo-ligase